MKFNCKYFLGDRPCRFHKEKNVKCEFCQFYVRQGKKILIIKLASLGDVLRTTFIVRGLNEKYRNSHICWLTEPECVPLLEKNSYIDRILPYGLNSYTQLLVEKFDILINLDADFRSASLATLVEAKRKMGFGMDRNGRMVAFNSRAKEWLNMSLWDDLKKRNKKTYQEIMCEIIGINVEDKSPIVSLTDEELAFAKVFLKKNNFNKDFPLIGFNLEAGKRWPKAWPKEYFLELAGILNKQLKANVLILRAPNSQLDERFAGLDFIIDGGAHPDIREFASLLNLVDLLVTADTFALHVALAFGKKVVVLFGPTSPQEVDVFGKGEKVVAPLDCVGCYRNNCSKTPNCLEKISPDSVFEAIKRADLG